MTTVAGIFISAPHDGQTYPAGRGPHQSQQMNGNQEVPPIAELPAAFYLGVFTRAEQRVLAAILRAIAQDGGRCVATLAMLARAAGASRSTTRNAINQAVGLLAKIERRFTASPRFRTFDDGAAPAPRRRRPSPLELPAQFAPSPPIW